MKAERNDPCPCGSGVKYKKCCLPKEDTAILRPISEISEADRERLKDFTSDVGKMIHGSAAEPIQGSHDDDVVSWQVDYIAQFLGSYKKLMQSLLGTSANKHVDRIVALAKDGVCHVFYFDVSHRFGKLKQELI